MGTAAASDEVIVELAAEPTGSGRRAPSANQCTATRRRLISSVRRDAVARVAALGRPFPPRKWHV